MHIIVDFYVRELVIMKYKLASNHGRRNSGSAGGQ